MFTHLTRNWPQLLAAATVLVFSSISTSAATFQKANNTSPLNDPNSWIPTGTPGAADIAQWDATITGANGVNLGANASWGGILVSNTGGLVTISNDGSALTIGASGINLSWTNNGLTIASPVILGASQAWSVTNSRTITVNGPISDGGSGFGITKNGNGGMTLAGTNSFSGPIILNAGTLTLSSSNAWPGAASLTFGGGTLAVNAGVILTNLPVLASNKTATVNLSLSGIIPGNFTISAGSTNVTPQNAIYTTPASGFAQMNLSASMSAGGFITNYGVLNLTGTSSQTIGTLVGPGSDAAGNLGGIQDNNTFVNGKTITLANGSSFAYFKPGAGATATLQIVSNGSAFIKWFGYNNTLNMIPYTNILNGGTWSLANIGQNNSASHYVGICTLSNAAVVTVTNNINYVHGTWNVINGSTFTLAQGATAVQQGHNANNFGLNISVGSGGSFFTGASLNLGQQALSTNSISSLNINSGGLIRITNNLTIGTATAQVNETNTVNVNGGKLVVPATISAAAVTSGQVRNFNWNSGQISAATITPSLGFSDVASGISSAGVTNTAGILAPGDDGIPGRTVINGAYLQTNSGVIAMDLGGTARAASFQTNTAGYYDYLQVVGPITLGGSLKIKLVGGYTPAYTDQLNIIATSGAGNFIAGNFTNLIAGPGLGRVPVEGMTNTYFTAIINSQTNTLYLINFTNLPTVATYPTNISYTVINGGTELSLNWPATHLGWTLQAQTNTLNVGLTTNGWVDVPGTASVITTNLPIVPGNPAVFYRLRQ